MLELSGHDIRLGLPKRTDAVAVWGRSPTAWRGEALARRQQAGLIRVEDAFLRSVKPGRSGDPALGLIVDPNGVYFDASAPSKLETLLASHPLDDAGLMADATQAGAALVQHDLSKYSNTDLDTPLPFDDYVLVIDQTRGDASIQYGQADAATFATMLAQAKADHPSAQILIKTHPETQGGHRAGHFDTTDEDAQVHLWSHPSSPHHLLAKARAVYVVTSQLGFEAIMAGHRPVVFGQPWYAGWGLSSDQAPIPRRTRQLSQNQMFAAAMILAPIWFDPYHDRLTDLEGVIRCLTAQTKAWRADHKGWTAGNIRLWKRGWMSKWFGTERRLRFQDLPSPGVPHMSWGDGPQVRLEDGFLRSRGLGAQLVPPLSLILDSKGIYFDPRQASDLDDLLNGPPLQPRERTRAAALRQTLCETGLSKYNLAADTPRLPKGHRILVPGQVENDASILLGAAQVRTNRDLLTAVRAANPDAVIVYKPHPDVVAGLRPGAVPDAQDLADVVIQSADAIALLPHVAEVWTITSLLGFEALVRGVPVTTLGRPFYAGWGLTTDHAPQPTWRHAKPDLNRLIHRVLIDYPRYRDPVTGLPCPAEVVVNRLINGPLPAPGPGNRLLAKAQGLLASRAYLWR